MHDVKSAARVLDTLELLAGRPDGMSLKEITRSLDIPSSSCHGLLRTLSNRGYVIRDDSVRTYRLGMQLFQIAGVHADSVDLVRIADPVLDRISLVCGETVSVAIREGTDVVFIHKKTSSGVIRVVNPVGTRLPAHGTALGKVLLAELPEGELDALYPSDPLERCTPNTLCSRQALKSCLAEVRDQGIAFDVEESAIGVQAVGAPIRDHSGRAVAAISIALVSVRERDQDYWHLLGKLTNTGAQIVSSGLGYPEGPHCVGLPQLDQIWHGERTGRSDGA